MEKIILVDEDDREIGSDEKLKVHREGKLHRAFSIFIFNSRGDMMLQRRARVKYHSGGLWTNACCSHPRPGEKTPEAAHRRLFEEMGFDCPLEEIFSFVYKVELDNDFIEHEYDHVFMGKFDGEPEINFQEADEWKWMNPDDLRQDVEKHPEHYTYWFRIALDRINALT